MPKSSPVRVRRWLATTILTLSFIAVAGAAAIGWWYARESPPHQGPIVVIAVDGLEPSALNPPAAPESASGLPGLVPAIEDDAASEPPLPGLAAFARTAVVFDRAYTHSPQQLPAHASLLTGQLPFEHGVRDEGGYELARSIRTLPELLRNRGFSTGAAVSSFLLRPSTGVAQGFSFYDADEPDAASLARSGQITLDAAQQWARRQRDRRYFLLTQVAATDAEMAVDRLVGMLEEQGFYDTSTIVLVGDRGLDDTDGPLSEGTLRVPLLIKQPHGEGAGRHISAPVQHIDLVPTILDLVRAPIPGDLRGRSLRPVLGGAEERLPPQPIYSEWLAAHVRFDGPPVLALTMNESRYVRGVDEQVVPLLPAAAPGGDDPDAPATGAPLADPAADAVAPLRATLDRLLGGDRVAPPYPSAAAVRDRLALAGYLRGLRPPDGVGLTPAVSQVETIAEAHDEAARLAGERRLSAAVRVLQGIVRVHPSLASVHYQIGLLSMEVGRPAAAVAAFRAAAELRPDAPDVPRGLALALARMGDDTAAREQAALGVALARPLGARDAALAHETAARVALLAGDGAAAIAAADAAEAADPSLPMHAYIEGRLHNGAGRPEQALPLLQEASRVLDQHASSLEGVYQALGEALEALDRPQEAEAAFRREIRDFPANVAAYTRLAALFSGPDRLEDAARTLDALVAVLPTPEAYAEAARTWMELGQRSRAEAVRSEARARFRGEQPPALLVRERVR